MKYKKRYWLPVIIIMIFAMLVACKKQAKEQVVFTSLDGNTIAPQTYQGKWIIINYWASWCKPCYQEIPELNHFYESTQHDNVVLFGVSYDKQDPLATAKLAKQMGIAFPILSGNPIYQFGIKNIPGLPVTYIISPEGKLVKKLLGPQTENDLKATIQDSLASP